MKEGVWDARPVVRVLERGTGIFGGTPENFWTQFSSLRSIDAISSNLQEQTGPSNSQNYKFYDQKANYAKSRRFTLFSQISRLTWQSAKICENVTFVQNYLGDGSQIIKSFNMVQSPPGPVFPSFWPFGASRQKCKPPVIHSYFCKRNHFLFLFSSSQKGSHICFVLQATM